MKKAVLILSGYNFRAVLAFCRWAGTHRVPFALIARNESDPVFRTTYRDHVLLTRSSEELTSSTLIDWIQAARTKTSTERWLILPSTEYLNRLMLNSRAEIEQAGGIVPLTDVALYEEISDKYSFGVMCASSGIRIPEEHHQMPGQLPFVAKPKSYSSIQHGQLKPYLIHNEEDLRSFMQKQDPEEFYFQEFVYGRSLYLFYYLNEHGIVASYSQENFIQQANGGSVIAAKAGHFHMDQRAKPYAELLQRIRFRGLIMIEVRENKDGEWLMIEANPRMWGPMQLCADHGADFFGALLRDYGFEVTDSNTELFPGSFYFWAGGWMSKGPNPVFHNYTSELFSSEFRMWMKSDLFLRTDSLELYFQEIQN